VEEEGGEVKKRRGEEMGREVRGALLMVFFSPYTSAIVILEQLLSEQPKLLAGQYSFLIMGLLLPGFVCG
jgi:hypothetical protein